MNDKQMKELISALNIKNDKLNLSEVILKIGVPLCLAGIIFVANQLPSLDKKMALVENNQAMLRKQIETITKFTETPRFTKQDFITEMKLYEQRISLIDIELKNRREFMNLTEDRLREVERENMRKFNKMERINNEQ